MARTVLIAHDIRSAHNVGSLFRTADAAGVEKIFLSRQTATPTDRFGRERTDIKKVALGAEQSIPWEVYDDVSTLLSRLHHNGWHTVSLEQSSTAIPYTDLPYHENLGVIVGNEVSGIPVDVRSLTHVTAEIPQFGEKESLNVSVAAGIFLFHRCFLGKLNGSEDVLSDGLV